jgi:hypothetical protein
MPLSRAGDFFLTLRRLQSMIQETTEALRADQPRWDRSSKVIPINRRRYGSRRGRLIIAITLVVGIAVACFYSVYHGAPPPIDPKSIAVLPFDNVGEEKQDEYFGDGLTTEVIFLCHFNTPKITTLAPISLPGRHPSFRKSRTCA